VEDVDGVEVGLEDDWKDWKVVDVGLALEEGVEAMAFVEATCCSTGQLSQ